MGCFKMIKTKEQLEEIVKREGRVEAFIQGLLEAVDKSSVGLTNVSKYDPTEAMLMITDIKGVYDRKGIEAAYAHIEELMREGL